MWVFANGAGQGRSSTGDWRQNGTMEVKNLTDLEFGLTLTVIGMGGTLVILFLISLVVDVLNKCLPHPESKKEGGAA